MCLQLGQTCVEDAGSAFCGSCLPFNVPSTGNGCRGVRDCADAGCVAAHRTCMVATTNADAICLVCEPQYVEVNSMCVFNADAGLDCAALNCGSRGRDCATVGGQSMCTTCLPATPIDDPSINACRAARQCGADGGVTCSSGQICIPGSATADATCTSSTNCPTNCQSVAGSNGNPVLIGDAGVCVCDTAPNYFYTLSSTSAPIRCDQDNDGWINATARRTIQHADPSIRALAKCQVAVINRVVLEADDGRTLNVPVTLAGGPVPLYETQSADQNSSSVPYNPQGARQLFAGERNSLTKACIGASDVNENGVPDIEEWGAPPFGAVAATSTDPNLQDLFPIYNQFAYFVELQRSWFQGTRGPSPLTIYPPPGEYHIAEKRRLGSVDGGPTELPLRYGVEDTGLITSEYWKTCPRATDRWYVAPSETRGLDFESLNGPDAGFFHSSQFKCFDMNSGAYSSLSLPQRAVNRQIQMLTSIQKDAGNGTDFQLNACSLPAGAGSRPPLGGALNPLDPIVSCTPVGGVPDQSVAWAAARIQEPEDFQRGCVKGCGGHQFLCPGLAADAGPTPCFTMCGDFAASEVKTLTGPAPDGGTYKLRGEIPFQPFSGTLGSADGGYTIRPPPSKPL